MIFSFQRYIEDYFARLNLSDVDDYAIRLANLYDKHALGSDSNLLKQMHRIRTVFYKKNASLERPLFEEVLLKRLRKRFQKKTLNQADEFPGGIAAEAKRLRNRPRTVARILEAFKGAIESRGVDSFWLSRKKRHLRSKPETIGQTLLAVFAKGILGDRGINLREVGSGIGFVDIAIILGHVIHLIEIKILKGSLLGQMQLSTYMHSEGRNHGWLVLFDARKGDKRPAIEAKQKVKAGTISVVVIDINPVPPSKMK